MPGRDLKIADPSAAAGRVRFKARLRRTWSSLSDLVLPPVCLSCHVPMTAHDTLCATCWSGIDFIRPPLCDRLGIPLPFATGDVSISAAASAAPPAYDQARAAAHYSGLMRRLIHELKFHDRDDLTRLLGGWLVDAGRDILPAADLIVPIPLSRSRAYFAAASIRRHVSVARFRGEPACQRTRCRLFVSGPHLHRLASAVATARRTCAVPLPCVKTGEAGSRAVGSYSSTTS